MTDQLSLPLVGLARRRVTLAVKAALAATDINQQIAADRLGKAESQISRTVNAGRMEIADLVVLGPDVVAFFIPLLAEMAGVEPQHYTVRSA